MSLFGFFRGLFDKKYLDEETIQKQVDTYNHHRKVRPHLEPHECLIQVWLSRMVTHGHDPLDEMIQTFAYTETHLFACLPSPQCARALGIYISRKESPEIVGMYPDIEEEYTTLMTPVLEAEQHGSLNELYKKYNPRMAEEIPLDT